MPCDGGEGAVSLLRAGVGAQSQGQVDRADLWLANLVQAIPALSLTTGWL